MSRLTRTTALVELVAVIVFVGVALGVAGWLAAEVFGG